MENRGATLRERTQAARTFMRVLPLPVPAMLKTRAPLVGYASRASASASAAVFCHAKRLSGSAGRKTASSEQGCSPVRDASGRSTRFAMRQPDPPLFPKRGTNDRRGVDSSGVHRVRHACWRRRGKYLCLAGTPAPILYDPQRQEPRVHTGKRISSMESTLQPAMPTAAAERRLSSRCASSQKEPSGSDHGVKSASSGGQGRFSRTSLPSGQGRREENRP